MSKDKLAESLEKNLPAESKPVKKEDHVKDDYEFSRDTYKDLINTGMASLDSLAEVARQTEHPRAYEVLSKAIKDIADTTDKLMTLQKNKKDLDDENGEGGKSGGHTTNNNLFVGSTTELQKLLADVNKQEEKTVIDVNAEDKE